MRRYLYNVCLKIHAKQMKVFDFFCLSLLFLRRERANMMQQSSTCLHTSKMFSNLAVWNILAILSLKREAKKIIKISMNFFKYLNNYFYIKTMC